MSNLRPTRGDLENLGWRALWSFLFATTSTLTGASVFAWDVQVWEAAVAGGVGAVLSVLKNFSSRQLGTQGGTP